MKLKILVGTMTSTAEYVAQSIQMDCTDLVSDIEVVLMDGKDISVFDEDALYLICSSTYGSGDVPDNARAQFGQGGFGFLFGGGLHDGGLFGGKNGEGVCAESGLQYTSCQRRVKQFNALS